MAGYSARQSTYTTGDTITAADTNDEFTVILAAFDATTGHAHDGTAGEGPLLIAAGALNTGSITSGFGNIDNGTSDITSGGIWTVDVDGTAIGAAGSINFGAAGNDAAVYWDGSNFRIDTTAAVDIRVSGTSVGTWDNGGIDLVTGDTFAINSTDVLNATTLGSAVVTSSLTTVGALDSGSITSGFGSVDVGSSTISTTGTVTTGAISAGGGLTFTGANPDIIGGDTDGILAITADTATNQGGNIWLYGNTHSTKAQDIEFYADATMVLSWDESEANWDFGGQNIKGSGTSDLSGGTVTGPSGTWDSGGMDLASSDTYAIDSTDVLTATTLGGAVVNSSLTSLGTITSLVATTADINAGTFDGVVGGTTPAAGSFTTLAITGAVTGNDQTVSAINLKDYGEVTNALGAISGATAIDLNAGNSVTISDVTGTTTFTFSNPTASDELCGFTLGITNGSDETINWPASVDWAGASAPTLSGTGGSVDWLVFWTVDGGTIWNGALVGAAFA
tara:strand:- start:321 stop:1841 length:1521 start_codon:yes stop_codon:yes gene_type:complete